MNANSAAKISQINQLAANATPFKTLDDASASITKTRISARVAAYKRLEAVPDAARRKLLPHDPIPSLRGSGSLPGFGR
jgi:hypothetical protein